eukprot:Hpha_TRINITY_DN22674_c0_g1::TRINITY_DN22674_c0_g1_i1::g.192748::m.192748/K08057/CALR; calreticulin
MRTVVALLGLVAGVLAGGTELKDAGRVKDRFSKKAVKKPTVVGYLPTLNTVDDFNKVADEFGGLPFYYVHDRSALDRLGMVSGSQPVVSLLRPWAGSKKFKVTFRGNLDTPKFRDWLVNEALEPLSFVPSTLSSAFEASAGRQRKAIVRGFIASERPNPESVKPADWDQPKMIPDPAGERPDDWSDEDDGEWEATQIQNPAFKGEWVQERMSTLIPDPADEKPEDWEQPKQIPDPRATTPDDWDEDEDGKFEAPEIPNPGYKGEWLQKTVPKQDEVKRMQELLKPVADKLKEKAIVIVQDASTQTKLQGEYQFTDGDYADYKAIAIEESKYSAMKQANVWITYKYPGDGLSQWANDWANKKLVDMDKAKRAAAKDARLKAKKA